MLTFCYVRLTSGYLPLKMLKCTTYFWKLFNATYGAVYAYVYAALKHTYYSEVEIMSFYGYFKFFLC